MVFIAWRKNKLFRWVISSLPSMRRGGVGGLRLKEKVLLVPLLLGMFWLGARPVLADGVDLRELFSPARHQGNRNTCAAFAAAALAEAILFQQAGVRVDLSEQHLYWLSKHRAPEGDWVRQAYAAVDGIAGFLAVEALRFGVTDEAGWPYSLRNGVQLREPDCLRARGFELLECFTGRLPSELILGSTDDRRLALAPGRVEPVFVAREGIAEFMHREKRPVVVNLRWYSALFDSRGNLARLPTPEEQEQCESFGRGCGGHVVLLVGYLAETDRFILRNSWGTGWGDSGYGSVPREYVLKHCETCSRERDLPSYPAEQRAFFEKSLQGVSARLRGIQNGVSIRP